MPGNMQQAVFDCGCCGCPDCDTTDRPMYVTGDYTVTVNSLGGVGAYGPFIYWQYEFVGSPCEFDLYIKCENDPNLPTSPDPAHPETAYGGCSWTAIVGCHHLTGTPTVSIISVNPFLCIMTCDAPPGNPFGCDLPKTIVISE